MRVFHPPRSVSSHRGPRAEDRYLKPFWVDRTVAGPLVTGKMVFISGTQLRALLAWRTKRVLATARCRVLVVLQHTALVGRIKKHPVRPRTTYHVDGQTIKRRQLVIFDKRFESPSLAPKGLTTSPVSLSS